ncbi:MAG: acyl-CoA thioesterase [Bacteroidetes bacterium]|nr:acyl-CoA thioesterase [Bacteroidota bacterium]
MKREISKTPRDSAVEMTELVLPNDTNGFGALLGGRLMHWIDIVGVIAAMRHARALCVTASVDELQFHHPIHLGEVVILRATVNRAFRTSMEVGVQVEKENLLTGERTHTNTAYLTFVALGEDGTPTPVPRLKPVTKEEKKRYREAAHRRKKRLLQRQVRQ